MSKTDLREMHWAEWAALWQYLTGDPHPQLTLHRAEAAMRDQEWSDYCDAEWEAMQVERWKDDRDEMEDVSA